MTNMLEKSAKQLFATHCTAKQVRDVVEPSQISGLWDELTAAGFADALTGEDRGGAGLQPIDLVPVLFQAGEHAAPLPLGETMLLRSISSQAAEAGSIAIAPARVQSTKDGDRLSNVPFGRVVGHVVAQVGAEWTLVSLDTATVVPSPSKGSLNADIFWPQGTPGGSVLEVHDWRSVGALMRAVDMAAAMARLLEMTVDYAKEREQFGRAIAKQQAIQQQISLMAEECYAARMAAELGLAGYTDPTAVAIAKSRVGEAASRVGPIAHAVHGAIGITQEHDLHLYTRRLIEGRIAYGSERYWNEKLGQSLLDSTQSSLSFVQSVSARKTMPVTL
ncbi:acyl-CoA dehydrogenase family protein [Sulfitobacter faviae]|uniref:acyl-CoA dehydrogenase family protein n=1 Tax=Sulfitobacter faviae TaxID=1775881 RepID=UPI00398D3C37